MAEEKKIIDIDVPVDKALESIVKLQAEMMRLQNAQKGLAKGSQETGAEFAANQIKLKEYGNQVRVLQKETGNSIKITNEKSGSLNQLKAALSNATAQYNNLSKAEREGSAGSALRDNIKSTSDELKKAEGELGNYTRNVGDYEGAMNRVLPVQLRMLQGIGQTVTAAGGVVPAMAGASTAVKSFGMQMLKLLANPIVALIAAIAMAILALVATFRRMIEVLKGNEEQSNRLSAALAPLRAIADVVTRQFEKMAEVFLKIVEAVMSAVTAFLQFIGVGDKMNEQTQHYIQLEQEKQRLIIATRKLNEDSAARELEISKLKNQSMQTEKYTAEERLAFNTRANDLERKNADERKKLAYENLRILELEARRTKNSAEMMERLSAAKIAVIQADTEYYNNTRRLERQETTFIREIEAEKEKLRKEGRERTNAARDNEIKKAESQLQISILQQGRMTEKGLNDNWKKEKAIIDMKVRYSKLTAEEATIARLQSEKRYNDGLLQLANARVQKEVDNFRKLLMLENLKNEESLVNAELSASQRFDIDFKKLQDVRRLAYAEIDITKDVEQQKRLIEQQFSTEVARIDKQLQDSRAAIAKEALITDLQNEMEIKRMSLLSDYRLEIDMLNKKRDEELAIAERTGADKSLITKKYAGIERKLQQAQLNSQAQAVGEFMGAVQGLYRENSKGHKIAATAQAVINTYLGVTNAIAQTQGGIFAQIAGGVTALIAGFSTVKKIWSVDIDNPSLSGGATISGANSGTGGATSSRIAQPAQSTANKIGGIGGSSATLSGAAMSIPLFNQDSMTAAMFNAFASLPQPVVSVEEIRRVDNNVRVIDSLSTFTG